MKDKEEKKESTALVKPDELAATEALVLNSLSKRILGGITQVKDKNGNFVDDTSAIDYKESLKKYEEAGGPMTQELTMTDPTGQKVITYILEHGGTSDQKLAMVLADPDKTKEQKEAMLSLYLFEMGKESSSFLTDLMLFKGQNTRENRQFQSRMQMDWTFFVNLLTNIMMDQAGSMLAVVAPGKNVYDIQRDALNYLKEKEDLWKAEKEKWDEKHKKEPVRPEFPKPRPSLHDWAEVYYGKLKDENDEGQKDSDKLSILMLELGVRYAAESYNIQTQMKSIVQQREAERGKPHPNL